MYSQASNLDLTTKIHRPGWQFKPSKLSLPEDEVHIWKTQLDVSPEELSDFERKLSEDERNRAKRFRFSADRQSYIVSRATLRAILQQYLDIEPRAIEFCYSPYGKPFLQRNSGCPHLSFNLSHSGSLAVYAFSCEDHIGIDLELIRPDFTFGPVARLVFSPDERKLLKNTPQDLAPLRFFSLWTRKEAYLKAQGAGFSTELDLTQISVIHVDHQISSATNQDWQFLEFYPHEEYVAAFVIQGHPRPVNYFHYEHTSKRREIHPHLSA